MEPQARECGEPVSVKHEPAQACWAHKRKNLPPADSFETLKRPSRTLPV